MTDAFLNLLTAVSYMLGTLLGVYLFTKTNRKLATWFSWLPGLFIAYAGVQLNTYILILPGCFLLATIGGPALVLILRDMRGQTYAPSQLKKRPTGIVIIAVLLTLVSIYSIYVSLNIIIDDLGVQPYLSAPHSAHEWLSFGIPAEMMIGFYVLACYFLTLFVAYGLYSAKSWSYDFALALPVFVTVLNLASMGLYASAPAELELGEATANAIPFIVMNLVWLIGVWSYLRKPNVKQYLNHD